VVAVSLFRIRSHSGLFFSFSLVGVNDLQVAEVLEVMLHQGLFLGQLGELLAVLINLVEATVE